MRGWTRVARRVPQTEAVYPAYAGMALMNMLQHCTADDFPCKRMERTRYHLCEGFSPAWAGNQPYTNLKKCFAIEGRILNI